MKKLHTAVVIDGRTFAGCEPSPGTYQTAKRPKDVTCTHCQARRKRTAQAQRKAVR